MHEILKDKKGTREYEEYFLNYVPSRKGKENDELMGFKQKIASNQKTIRKKSKNKKTKKFIKI